MTAFYAVSSMRGPGQLAICLQSPRTITLLWLRGAGLTALTVKVPLRQPSSSSSSSSASSSTSEVRAARVVACGPQLLLVLVVTSDGYLYLMDLAQRMQAKAVQRQVAAGHSSGGNGSGAATTGSEGRLSLFELSSKVKDSLVLNESDGFQLASFLAKIEDGGQQRSGQLGSVTIRPLATAGSWGIFVAFGSSRVAEVRLDIRLAEYAAAATATAAAGPPKTVTVIDCARTSVAVDLSKTRAPLAAYRLRGDRLDLVHCFSEPRLRPHLTFVDEVLEDEAAPPPWVVVMLEQEGSRGLNPFDEPSDSSNDDNDEDDDEEDDDGSGGGVWRDCGSEDEAQAEAEADNGGRAEGGGRGGPTARLPRPPPASSSASAALSAIRGQPTESETDREFSHQLSGLSRVYASSSSSSSASSNSRGNSSSSGAVSIESRPFRVSGPSSLSLELKPSCPSPAALFSPLAAAGKVVQLSSQAIEVLFKHTQALNNPFSDPKFHWLRRLYSINQPNRFLPVSPALPVIFLNQSAARLQVHFLEKSLPAAVSAADGSASSFMFELDLSALLQLGQADTVCDLMSAGPRILFLVERQSVPLAATATPDSPLAHSSSFRKVATFHDGSRVRQLFRPSDAQSSQSRLLVVDAESMCVVHRMVLPSDERFVCFAPLSTAASLASSSSSSSASAGDELADALEVLVLTDKSLYALARLDQAAGTGAASGGSSQEWSPDPAQVLGRLRQLCAQAQEREPAFFASVKPLGALARAVEAEDPATGLDHALKLLRQLSRKSGGGVRMSSPAALNIETPQQQSSESDFFLSPTLQSQAVDLARPFLTVAIRWALVLPAPTKASAELLRDLLASPRFVLPVLALPLLVCGSGRPEAAAFAARSGLSTLYLKLAAGAAAANVDGAGGSDSSPDLIRSLQDTQAALGARKKIGGALLGHARAVHADPAASVRLEIKDIGLESWLRAVSAAGPRLTRCECVAALDRLCAHWAAAAVHDPGAMAGQVAEAAGVLALRLHQLEWVRLCDVAGQGAVTAAGARLLERAFFWDPQRPSEALQQQQQQQQQCKETKTAETAVARPEDLGAVLSALLEAASGQSEDLGGLEGSMARLSRVREALDGLLALPLARLQGFLLARAAELDNLPLVAHLLLLRCSGRSAAAVERLGWLAQLELFERLADLLEAVDAGAGAALPEVATSLARRLLASALVKEEKKEEAAIAVLTEMLRVWERRRLPQTLLQTAATAEAAAQPGAWPLLLRPLLAQLLVRGALRDCDGTFLLSLLDSAVPLTSSSLSSLSPPPQ